LRRLRQGRGVRGCRARARALEGRAAHRLFGRRARRRAAWRVRRLPLALLVVAALAACGGKAKTSFAPLSSLGRMQAAPNPGKLGPEFIPEPNAPALAPAASKATPTHTVDGIKCERDEKLAFHIHAHVTLFVNGKQRALPGGIGIWPKLERQSG